MPGPTRKRRVPRWVLIGLGLAVGLWLISQTLVPAPKSQAHPRGKLPDLSRVRATTGIDARLSRVVTNLARRPTVARCWSHADWKKRVAEYASRYPSAVKLGPWAAYTSNNPTLTVDLSPEICIELKRLARLRTPVWDDASRDGFAVAVAALAHESAHATGWLNEAMAECLGMQAIRVAAMELGKTPKEGSYLGRRYWQRWYSTRPRSYRSVECQNGHALDLQPQSDSWP